MNGLRARVRLLFGGRAAESRMTEEMQFHVEMEADRLMREEKLSREEAWRRAQIAFGGVEKCREQMRSERGLAWLGGLRLDLKLGARTLVKYPVLALTSVLTMAIAVTLAASWFEFMYDMLSPRLPLPEGDRIVAVQNYDAAAGAPEPQSLHEFEAWRGEVRSVTHLTAHSKVTFNVSTEDRRYATLSGRRMSASGFELARVKPLLGRPLRASDEDPGAPLVAVLGYSAWQTLFDGDRAAIGRTLRLGSETATVVGVMPEGFAFPVNEEIWVPLRERALAYGPREGPAIGMIGRLAPGYSVDEAQAELEALSRRTAAAFPQTHEHLRARVNRFGVSQGIERVVGPLLNIPFLLFLLVVCANVATLHFARIAAREGEIAVRSALGASRRRLILQLMAEALVLTLFATAAGLAMAHYGMQYVMDLFFEVQQSPPPFWFDFGLSGATVLYALLLALIGAAIVGGLPALRVTGRGIRHRLTMAGAGGAGMRFGRIATGVIVIQVAISVAFLPFAIMNANALIEDYRNVSFPAGSFLTGKLAVEKLAAPNNGAAAGEPAVDPRAARTFDEIHRRLQAEPGVAAVTRASWLPGFNHVMSAFVLDADSAPVLETRSVGVDANFFDVMGGRIAAGRGLRPEDVALGNRVMVVDEEWAQDVFDGRSALGQRLRVATKEEQEPGPWYEIVGVVAGIEQALGPGGDVNIFVPLRAGATPSMQVFLRTTGDPAALAPQVQSAIAAVDPDVALSDLLPLEEVWRPSQRSERFYVATLAVVAGIILLFTLVGIYAMMSFAVMQRSREIGIRSALGADARRIIVTIFSRAAWQIGLGVVLGATLISLTVADDPSGRRVVGAVAGLVVVVALLACTLPAMRALRIQPTEALRAE